MGTLGTNLTTLNDIFFRIAHETGERAILRLEKNGQWQPLSGMQVYRRVRALAASFHLWGLVKGDRVVLVSENRWEWAITDFASLAIGLVDVPIFPTLHAEQTGDLIAHSGAKIAVVSSKQQFDKVAKSLARSSVERIVIMDDVSGIDAIPFSSLMEGVDDAGNVADADFDALARSIAPEDLATIIYTSGTTGEPKGVMLTHGNIAQNLNFSLREFTFLPGDSSVSFLPLSHVTARHVDYALYSQKVAIAYCPSLEKLVPALKAVQPTYFIGVPRVYEKIRQETERRAYQSPMKKRIVQWALRTGERHRASIERGATPGSPLWKLANKLFYTKLAAGFGGNVRHYIAGGAPLGIDSAEWFLNAGIRILEGYGLTETSPVLGVNTPPNYRIGSVGKVLPNIEARIAEDGELIVRGPNVFKGYWQNPEMTAAALDSEGWFSTGDIARIDAERYLFITDRKKEMIKTSAGKLVAPQPIENKLKTDSFVGQAALVGDREKYVAALISPNFAALEPWAKEKGIAFTSRKELVENPAVLARYKETIKQVNRSLADHELLKRFVVVPEEWAESSGELTPSLKLKRRVIQAQYKDEIASLFR